MRPGDLSELSAAIIDGNLSRTRELVQAAIDQSVPPEEIVTRWMVPAMAEVGCRFERQEYFVPEMLISARAMQAGLTLLRPLLVQRDIRPLATVVIGTVKGDLHDIGKNLVAMMLEGAGFRVVDLGVDVPVQRFIQAVREHEAQILGLSALLTTTMAEMEAVILALGKAELRTRVKVLVGGAPVTARYAAQIGADGYGENANAAVQAARRVLNLGGIPA
ncbi:MAG: corrinoid protein [Armatimonadota bacterium]|nr:corrinoid protein [Armatimonadota bacterium]MDR7519284.1 corrinoid protein [Armatimonadota bacterium]MDR7551203.1 corrinoid protein [Armatimonadota bacterium]